MEQEIDKKSFIDTDIEEADNAHSNVGVYANLKEKSNPFSDITSSFDAPNLSTQLYNSIPSVFQDETFGLFNRAITQPIIDTADAAIRTADMALKGFATGANELKNLYTGEDDDRLKRDIYGFFTAGSPAAVTRPVNVAGRVKQLLDRGEDIEAGKLMYSQVKSPVAAMTKKREPSPARKMTETERALRNKRIEKDREEFRIRTFGYDPNKTDNIVDTSYRMQHQPRIDGARLDDITGGGTYFPEDVYSAQGLRYYGNPNNKAEVLNYNIIKSVRGKPDAEVTIYRGVPDDSKITTINEGDFVTLNKKYAEDHASSGYGFSGQDAGKVISKKVKVKDIVSDGNDLNEFGYFPTKKIKEAPPLEIGASKFALDGNLISKYDVNTIKMFDDLAVGARAGSARANAKIGKTVKDGTKIGIRKNLNSISTDGKKGILQTLHKNNYDGEALSYQPYATVENVVFDVNQKHRRRIASKARGLAVPESKSKFNMASVNGNYLSNRNLLKEGYETEIKFAPDKDHLFVDVKTGQGVKGAEMATVIGDRVFANGVTYWKKADAPNPLDASDGTKLTSEVRYRFRRGGLMARA